MLPLLPRAGRVVLGLLAAAILSYCQPAPTDQEEAMTETQSLPQFDWQGHRGARGLLPENTIPAFLHALEYPLIKTLELDVVISADGQVVVSHEPWMSPEICLRPDGSPVTDDTINLYQLTYAEIRQYDCGSRGHERFPDQQPQATFKPLLAEVIAAADARARELDRPLPYYNIEIKSRPEHDGRFTPPPAEFAGRVVDVVLTSGIAERAVIQSFDPRSIQAVYARQPRLALAYLDEAPGELGNKLDTLGFKPAIYSPYYPMVTANLVREIHNRGMRIIPWTVNDSAAMRELRDLGVDGIITDYPNRIPASK